MADDADEFDAKSGRERLQSGLKDIEGSTQKLSAGANSFARAITAAFAQGATGAKSFDTVLKSLALRLSSLSLNLALRPLTGALGGGLQQLFGGLSGVFTGTAGTSGGDKGPLADATKMAKGGVIAAPTYFPLGNSRVGLAGEAGPEAIMPLARGPDGRLGVAASGTGGGNVTVNIATADAESFRRSEAYLTGMIARAVARGQRGM